MDDFNRAHAFRGRYHDEIPRSWRQAERRISRRRLKPTPAEIYEAENELLEAAALADCGDPECEWCKC